MGNVYVVTSGSYSDYSIVAVFAREEDAEEYVRLNDNIDGERVEVYPLLAELPSYQVVHQKRGWLDPLDIHGRIADDGSESTSVEWEPFGYGVRPKVHGSSWLVSIEVFGTDLQAVRQAFSDRRARLKAELDLAAQIFEAE